MFSLSRTQRWSLIPAAAICLSVPAASPASADPVEFCVTCSGPTAQYRCALPPGSGKTPPPGFQLHCISTLAREGGHESCTINRATQGACAGALKIMDVPTVPSAPVEAAVPSPPDVQQAPAAELGNRAAVPAPSPVGPPADDVEVKALAKQPVAAHDSPAKPVWDDTSGSPKPAAEDPKPAQEAAVPADGPQQPESDPLKSAGQAVGDAAKSTGSALQKAGDAVSQAAKKSWKCLTSLFGDC